MIEEVILPAVGSVSNYNSSVFGFEIWKYAHIEVSLSGDDWCGFVEAVDDTFWTTDGDVYRTMLTFENDKGVASIKVLVRPIIGDESFGVRLVVNSHSLSRMDVGLFLKWLAKYN